MMMNSNNRPNRQKKFKVNEKVIVRCDDPNEKDGYFDYQGSITSYNPIDRTYDIYFPFDKTSNEGIKENVIKNENILKIELKLKRCFKQNSNRYPAILIEIGKT